MCFLFLTWATEEAGGAGGAVEEEVVSGVGVGVGVDLAGGAGSGGTMGEGLGGTTEEGSGGTTEGDLGGTTGVCSADPGDTSITAEACF